MKTITRYIIKEFIPPFFLGLMCFTSILLLNEIFRLTKLFVRKGINPWYLIKLLIYVLPATLVVTIPMGTLMGILWSLGRLSNDNEIMAMRASGIGFYQLVYPLLAVSFGIFIFDFVFMDYALPRGNIAYAALKNDIRRSHSDIVLEEEVVMRELEQEGRMWMFEYKDENTGKLHNVKVWDNYRSGKPRIITADEADVGFESGHTQLKLYNGSIYEIDRTEPEHYTVTSFKQQNITLELTEDLQRSEYERQHPRNMSLITLRKYIDKMNKQVKEDKREYLVDRLRRAKVEYQQKSSIPFACFVFGLIGVPLGIVVRRSGKMVGLGIGLAMIIVYYMLLEVGKRLGLEGIMSPFFALWLPNFIIGIVGIVLIIRTVFEKRFLPILRDYISSK